MNLSSYLQMPPAPSASKSPATSPVSGAAAGARVDAGNSLGLDFAQIMSQQLERLPQMQRQTLAADPPQAQTATQEAISHRSEKRSDAADDRNDEHTSREDASSARTSARSNTAQGTHGGDDARNGPEDDESSSATGQRSHKKARQFGKTPSAQEHMNAALLQAMSPVAPTATNPLATAQNLASGKSSLQTFALSPHIQIITDPQQAPSNESLAEFAKSMGLDETAIQALIANGTPASSAAPDSMNAMSAANANPATQAFANGASQALMAALASHAPAQPATDAANPLSSLSAGVSTPAVTATQMASTASFANFGANVSANLLAPDAQALPGALLPPMSAADMASIEQIQITVMPSVVNGGNPAATSSMPSTQDVLSLLTGELKEQDISSLSALFNDASGNEQPADQQQGHPSSESSPFAQVLTSQSTPSTTQPSASAPTTAATHMSEVYEQLSDKLATEMAGRMHKQLSDGEWKMKFGLRPAHLGGVEIQLEMKDGKLDAVFRADNPLTRDLLQNSSQRLREALENFGIHAGQVHVGQQGGNAQQNASGNSANQSQVGDNSTLQVKGDESVVTASVASNKANASLLDLYA